jgi:uncharacterized protein (TIGR00369 family)
MLTNPSWKNVSEVISKVNAIPFYKTLSIRLVKIDEKGSTVKIRLKNKHKNMWDNVHGGVIASLVDIACALSVIPFLKDGETMVSVVLQVQYFAPAVVKGDLTGIGKVINQGKRLMNTDAEILDMDGHLVAKGTSVLRILK